MIKDILSKVMCPYCRTNLAGVENKIPINYFKSEMWEKFIASFGNFKKEVK
jgi:uncharacterized protein YbaR (Trm112 family)